MVYKTGTSGLIETPVHQEGRFITRSNRYATNGILIPHWDIKR